MHVGGSVAYLVLPLVSMLLLPYGRPMLGRRALRMHAHRSHAAVVLVLLSSSADFKLNSFHVA
eukprot:1787940-Alexandrium_andersonii.AAC.1